MRTFLLIYAPLLLFPFLSLAQPKNDYIWLFGYPNESVPPIPYYGGTMLDFHQSPVEVSWFDIPFWFHAHVVMSDKDGNLLFYTNGCQIRNWAHQLVENGDSLNFGTEYLDLCPNNGYPGSQSEIAIPSPENKSEYFIFHLKRDDIDNTIDKEFLFTLVHFDSSDDSGKVLLKNQLLLDDNFTDQVTSVQHGNGRDWWIILPQRSTNRHFVFLLDTEGPKLVSEQNIGWVWDFVDYVGQSVFSPDGSKFVRISAINGINIFDFDRCGGVLSNPVHISLDQDTVVNASATGVSVSPNNRFLYASVSNKVYQFDLYSPDIESTKTLVAYYDGYKTLGLIPTLFYQHMLAPDGKIYIVPPAGTDHLHVIHEPNKEGVACDLRQHDLELAALESWGMPNFPHFRTYDLPGSPCDTLGIDAPVTVVVEETGRKMLVYPNPANRWVSVKVDAAHPVPVKMSLFDGIGQTVLEKDFPTTSIVQYFALPELASGVYYLKFTFQNGSSNWTKLVVMQG